jgi:RND family efflux transporter MFP subunit
MQDDDNTHKHAKARRSIGRKVALRLALVGIGAVGIAFIGISSREREEGDLARLTQQEAIPTVEVVAPERGTSGRHLVLPGEVRAWYSAPIYARVNGYVKMWYKDIGAKVKAGDVLAEIDTPDLDQQYEQARDELARAQADAALAELTAKRWEAMRVTDAVSQQTADEKVGNFKALKAQVAAATANVARLAALEGFKKIVAPFDGVVTARETDIGALIIAGGASGPELFKVADIHKMRVFVQVPQQQSAGIHQGLKAKLYLPQYPNKVFEAVVATTSSAINQSSRTLLVELHIDNPDGLLQPGAFTKVEFELPGDPNVVRIPTSALLFRESGTEVAMLGPDDKVDIKPVTLGRNLGTLVEVVEGLKATDRIINSPSDSLATGDQVRVAGDSGPSSADAELGEK